MTLTVSHDLLTHFIFVLVERHKNQSPTQALINPFGPTENQRKKLKRVVNDENVTEIFPCVREIMTEFVKKVCSNYGQNKAANCDLSFDLMMDELERLSYERQSFYDELELDTIHYYTSLGHDYIKGLLSGTMLSFTDCERHTPINVFFAYINTILGDVKESSKEHDFVFCGEIYTDNPLKYIVVYEELCHLLYGGELDDSVDMRYILRWIPDINKEYWLVSTRYKIINLLYESLNPNGTYFSNFSITRGNQTGNF